MEVLPKPNEDRATAESLGIAEFLIRVEVRMSRLEIPLGTVRAIAVCGAIA